MEETSSKQIWPFGCKGEGDDVLTTEGKTSPTISQLLERAEVDAGEYSFGGQTTLLPAIPGLFIEGIGSIPVPLTAERKDKLLAISEQVTSSSWKLRTSQVTMKNPKWVAGMRKLGDKVGDRLGFKRIKLQCELKELLVFGPGEKTDRHQENNEDGVVATIAVQLPSEHSGGELVVYRGRELQFRHDFGTAKNAAAFLPHYAVYFADAPHAREEVTSGYQLILKYSLTLPSEMKHLKEAKGDKPLSEELAEVLKQIEPEDECFALLLEGQYKEEDVRTQGTDALSKMDKTRYRALLEANSLIPEDKVLVFHIAQLCHAVQQYDGTLGAHKNPKWKAKYAFWQDYDRKDFVVWYSVDGKKYGDAVRTMYVNEIDGPSEEEAGAPTFTPTFLNPGRLTLSEIWKANGYKLYDGFSGDRMKGTVALRYAVFAWPATKNMDYTFKFANNEAAAAVLQGQECVDANSLRKFMERASEEAAKKKRLGSSRRYNREDPKLNTLSFCQMMTDLIVKAGDATLVGLLLEKFVIGVDKKIMFADGIASLTQAFEWASVKDAVLNALNTSKVKYSYSWEADESIQLILQVLKRLKRGEAQTALLEEAVKKAINFPPKILVKARCRSLLIKLTIEYGDVVILTRLVDHFKTIKPNDLNTVIKAVSEHATDLNPNDEKFAVLASIVEPRLEWLNLQLDKLDKPFSWEMPDAIFVDNARVQAFLRGPEIVMTTRGLVYFRDLQHAQRWTRHTQENASFELTAEGSGHDAFVTITKTRHLYEKQQAHVIKLKEEKELLLTNRFKDLADNRGKKRHREEDEVQDGDATME
ncbi:hypothetical protein F444_17924 [Phytophthora nicotianae P1976]|uniref:Fe2OG dioxygenase domain-containing protein n=2 Tax=Phytophthora nicotianae TaxID=4792 RepID=A0A080ZDD0_PHYNI|nr:hypothetical protein F444_17924 [Phytophthora nicotianae P1976]